MYDVRICWKRDQMNNLHIDRYGSKFHACFRYSNVHNNKDRTRTICDGNVWISSLVQYVFGLIPLSLHLCRHVEISQCVDTDTRQAYLSLSLSPCSVYFTTFIFIHSYLRIYSLTCQMWIGFLLWRSRHGSWTVVWRHSPYWYYHWGRGCPRCSRAGAGSPAGSRPGSSAVYCFIGSTTGFHNHGEGPY